MTYFVELIANRVLSVCGVRYVVCLRAQCSWITGLDHSSNGVVPHSETGFSVPSPHVTVGSVPLSLETDRVSLGR